MWGACLYVFMRIIPLFPGDPSCGEVRQMLGKKLGNFEHGHGCVEKVTRFLCCQLQSLFQLHMLGFAWTAQIREMWRCENKAG